MATRTKIIAITRAAVGGVLDVHEMRDGASCNSATQLPGDRGVNPGADGNFDFEWAVRNGHVHVVRYLCELPGDRGVNPGANDSYAIRWAARNAHADVVRYLCELSGDRGVDPGADDSYAARWAARNGHVDVVRYLCELPGDRGVNPGADDNDAIQRAAAHNQLHVVRYLCAALPPHFQHVVPCVFRARHVCGCDGRCYCHAHRTQSVFSKFHTLFARLSARRSLLVLYALVRGRRCGYKPGQSGNGYGVTWREKGGSDGRLSTE